MESNDPLCVHFVFKCKCQNNAWILGEYYFYLEHYPIYQYLTLSIGIWFLPCFGTFNWYWLEFNISFIDICSNWYLLWEFWYPFALFYFTWFRSSITLLLVSFLLIDIIASIGVLSIICCVDLIPFDITLHVLMCFGINHLLIWFFLNHLLIWILI